MKKITLIVTILVLGLTQITLSQNNSKKLDLPKDKTALLIIDVQEFYFPGGQLPLNHPEKTSEEIKKVLNAFRKDHMTVIHIKHDASKNASIHPNLTPLKGEKVFIKEEANSFIGTGLDKYLKENNITHLVITGMQTQMCVEATTRAAYDKGYKCIVPEQTCTARALSYKGHKISASDVHYATLSTLSNGYAKVVDINTLLKAL